MNRCALTYVRSAAKPQWRVDLRAAVLAVRQRHVESASAAKILNVSTAGGWSQATSNAALRDAAALE